MSVKIAFDQARARCQIFRSVNNLTPAMVDGVYQRRSVMKTKNNPRCSVLGAAETLLAHGSLGAALGMAAFLVVMSTLIGTFVAAWLQGKAARMNPASVFIGLVFWGAMWGAWGLFLGPVMVVALKVMAEHTASGHRFARLMQG